MQPLHHGEPTPILFSPKTSYVGFSFDRVLWSNPLASVAMIRSTMRSVFCLDSIHLKTAHNDGDGIRTRSLFRDKEVHYPVMLRHQFYTECIFWTVAVPVTT